MLSFIQGLYLGLNEYILMRGRMVFKKPHQFNIIQF